MGEEHLFEELKRYVGFGSDDQACLEQHREYIAPHTQAIAEDFYDHIIHHSNAAGVFEDEAQVERLKGTLQVWITEAFSGPWDADYYEKRARIGQRHVQINLPQHYMFTAMNIIRGHLVAIVMAECPPETARRCVDAVNKILDLELAIMLHTYREDLLAKMSRSERLAAYGQVAASIAHELRNPLGVMDSSLYLLQRNLKEGDETSNAHVERLRGQVQQSNRIITQLLDLVRDQRPTPQPTPAHLALQDALNSLAHSFEGQLQIDIPDDLPHLLVDPNQLNRVLANVLANAFEAAMTRVLITAQRHGESAVMTIADDGPGIDPDLGPRIFDPLVTTKAQGIGLGLALCHRLMVDNGGRICIGTGPLPGASFELHLPLALGTDPSE